LDLAGLEYGPLAGSCGHRKEFSDLIKGDEFVNYMSESKHLKKDSAQ
jgi:hypothetical protein